MPIVIIVLFSVGGYLFKFNQTEQKGSSLWSLKSTQGGVFLTVSAVMFLLSIVGHVRRIQTEESGSDLMP